MHQSRRARRRKRRKILLIVEIVILVLFLVILFAWLKFGQIRFRDVGTVKTNKLSEKTVKSLSGYTNFLVLGVDSRGVGTDAVKQGRSDVQMIVSINNDTKKIRIASLYRDTLLNTDPMGSDSKPYQKSNAAYAKGGEKQTLEMVNGNLDLNLDKFVTFDFKAVTDVIDDLGGVEIDVTDAEYQAFQYKKYDYISEVARLSGKKATPVTHSGRQTLNGVQACSLCRIRHAPDHKGDLGRAERQRRVMAATLEKLRNASVSQISKIIDDVLPQVSTNFSATDILSLASAAKSYKIEKSFGFPYSKSIDTIKPWGSVLIPCTLEDNVERLHQEMFDETNYAPSRTVQKISQTIMYKTGKNASSAVDFSIDEGNKGIDDKKDDSSSTSSTTTSSSSSIGTTN